MFHIEYRRPGHGTWSTMPARYERRELAEQFIENDRKIHPGSDYRIVRD
jgi:hypothetical protein